MLFCGTSGNYTSCMQLVSCELATPDNYIIAINVLKLSIQHLYQEHYLVFMS